MEDTCLYNPDIPHQFDVYLVPVSSESNQCQFEGYCKICGYNAILSIDTLEEAFSGKL